MKPDHGIFAWGLCPQTPGIYRLGARMEASGGGPCGRNVQELKPPRAPATRSRAVQIFSWSSGASEGWTAAECKLDSNQRSKVAAPVTAVLAGSQRPGAGPSIRSASGGWAGPAGGASSSGRPVTVAEARLTASFRGRRTANRLGSWSFVSLADSPFRGRFHSGRQAQLREFSTNIPEMRPSRGANFIFSTLPSPSVSAPLRP